MINVISFAAFYVFAQSGQIGRPASEVSPEVVRQMHRQVEAQEDPITAGQAQRNHRAETLKLSDLARRIDDIMAQLEEMQAELAEKDMSRVAVLEEKVRIAAEERAAVEREAKESHNELMSWLRPASMTIGTAALMSFLGVIAGFLRGKRLMVVKKQVEVLAGHTNGMVEKLEQVAHDNGYEEGKAAAEREGLD